MLYFLEPSNGIAKVDMCALLSQLQHYYNHIAYASFYAKALDPFAPCGQSSSSIDQGYEDADFVAVLSSLYSASEQDYPDDRSVGPWRTVVGLKFRTRTFHKYKLEFIDKSRLGRNHVEAEHTGSLAMVPP